MASGSITELLGAFTSPDNAVRRRAEAAWEDMKARLPDEVGAEMRDKHATYDVITHPRPLVSRLFCSISLSGRMGLTGCVQRGSKVMPAGAESLFLGVVKSPLRAESR